MNLTIPIYVHTVKGSDGNLRYRCQPLLLNEPVVEHDSLQRAMTRLNGRLRDTLEELALESRHDKLAAAVFNPEMTTHNLKLNLDLRDRTAKCRCLFVIFQALNRRVAMTPSLPRLWFELDRGEAIQERAEQVLSQHFRNRAKHVNNVQDEIREATVSGEFWVAPMDLTIRVRQPSSQELDQMLAALWGIAEMDGSVELRRVGRCLDWLYPDDLDDAIGRDESVEQLLRLLNADDRRPVMVVGPRLVGKTAVVHAAVRRRVEKRKRQYSAKRNVWLISPQRLISGMSFVGQWENRLLAILAEAKKRRHILYLDDVLGLYQAGVSRESRLCVADVLKPFVQRRDLQILGEMTPEAFHAFVERDRGFADRFHVLRLDETNEVETMRVLLAVIRRLEGKHRNQFHAEVLPTVIEVYRRYMREAAFPGKAAGLLAQLAVKFQGRTVERHDVHREFHRSTGLSLMMLDRARRLTRETIVAQLQSGVVGQDEAVQAMADVVSVAKARLNDPERPLATFIFVGPTGVGKTQAAKTLAAMLFSDASKVVRLDMNEFGSPLAAARLVGTFNHPEGLLTSPVRHAPFSVVLLDEIEKADPDVFDLLLQVMGEGRLTDALGRTTDFTNAIVIMTSNLGVRESNQTVGFTGEGRQRSFLRAAEQFFRPELLNRIDRVIPFTPLSREHIREIAELLMKDVLQREGLARRRCVLNVHPDAMEQVVDQGYHPQLGARALRREIESQLTRTIAAELSGWQAQSPAVIGVLPAASTSVAARGTVPVQVQIQELVNVEPSPWHSESLEPKRFLNCGRQFVERAERELDPFRIGGEITVSHLTPNQFRYFAAQEQLECVRQRLRLLRDHVDRLTDQTTPPQVGSKARSYAQRIFSSTWDGDDARRILLEIAAAEDIQAYVNEVAERAQPVERAIEEHALELRHQAALMQCMLSALKSDATADFDSADGHLADACLLAIRSVNRTDRVLVRLTAGNYLRTFIADLDLQVHMLSADDDDLSVRYLLVQGPFARHLLAPELGTHLVFDAQGSMWPIQFAIGPVPVELQPMVLPRTPIGPANQHIANDEGDKHQIGDSHDNEFRIVRHVARPAWLDDQQELPPVIRIITLGGKTIDLRSGFVGQRSADTPSYHHFIAANHEPPSELRASS